MYKNIINYFYTYIYFKSNINRNCDKITFLCLQMFINRKII